MSPFARTCTLLLCLLLPATALAETPPPTGPAGYLLAGETVFVDDELTQVTVTMDQAALEQMINNPEQDVYYPGTVRVFNSRIDETVTNVGIKLRGNTSRFATKKSWKLKFNEFVSGRRFQGLKSFNLNGHQNDPSVVRGKLAWDVYNSFGVPSPRASLVRLVINDGSLVDDVYVNAEQIDDLFLDAWFGTDAGNLYQCSYKGERADLRFVAPGTAATYASLGTPTYELEEDSGANQFQDLADFIAFIDSADDASFAAQIVDRFSVDNFLRAMAVDAANGHWDNIWYGANNYFLYAHPDTGTFEYIPYDLDNTYGVDFFSTDWAARPPETFGDAGFGWDYNSPHGGGPMPPLVRRIFAIDAYRDQYFRYIRELVGAVGQPNQPETTPFADTAGDVFLAATDPHFDILGVTMANDESDLLVEVALAGPVDVGGSTDEARIVFFFDTRPGGSTSNPWGRQINTSRNADYFLGTWTDNGGGFILYEWTGNWTLRHASFDNPGGVAQDLSSKAEGLARYRVPLDRLGLSDTQSFAFDVVTTNDRGQSFEPGLDHLSNAAPATPNYDTASQAGPYPTHTLTPFTPGSVETTEGPFTLNPREAHIDSLRAQLAPFAYQGSFANGASDYGFDNQDFLDSYTLPASYSGAQPWSWGLKPYIQARTEYLRQNTPAPAPLPRVFVNEVIATNQSVIQDEAGEFEDYIELYNAEPDAVDLSGMYLSDDFVFPRKWRIPDGTVIAPGGFLLVWADSDTHQGPLHATFGLGAGGETVSLSHRDDQGAVLIDSLTYPGLGIDESFGRYPDGSDALRTFCVPTPAATNDPETDCEPKTKPTPRVFVNEWLASNDGVAVDEFGEADDFFELYNDEDFPVDLGGRYLTDNLSNRTKWRIPDGVTIPAKGHLVFWADNQPEQGPLHAPFALSAGGEAVGLFDRDDNALAPIDTVTFGSQTTDVAQGRSPDASDCIGSFAPTAGAPNPRGPSDVASPFGVLSVFDLFLFLEWYTAQDPRADVALPAGTINVFDLISFLEAYNLPCP